MFKNLMKIAMQMHIQILLKTTKSRNHPPSNPLNNLLPNKKTVLRMQGHKVLTMIQVTDLPLSEDQCLLNSRINLGSYQTLKKTFP
jgi:hypothetical protein